MSRTGRPHLPKGQHLVRGTVHLPSHDWDHIKEVGHDNLSRGMRIIMKEAIERREQELRAQAIGALEDVVRRLSEAQDEDTACSADQENLHLNSESFQADS